MAQQVEQGAGPIGFEAIAEAGDGQKAYTVTFTPSESEDVKKPITSDDDQPGYRTFTDGAEGSIPTGSEEIKLLEKAGTPSLEEKKLKEQTLFFEDGVRRIDFILTYQDELEDPEPPVWHKYCCCCLSWEKKKEDSEEKREKRKNKRERFLQSCIELGLEYEVQDCSESPDRKTYFVKFHASHECLLKGAEDLLLRMPIEKNTLKKGTWREAFFDCIKVADPFLPKIPEELEIDSYFTAPFKYERRENFIDWDKESFFSTARRAAIVWHVLQNARYGEEGDQIGVLRLLANNSFGQAYPLHEGSHNVKKDEEPKTERQFLYKEWSSWRKWYKNQPLDNIRHYYGEKVGIYFTWLGFYTSWLLPASIVGFIVFLYGLSTLSLSNNSVAADICRERNRTDYYMCPICDERCDFWWFTDTCSFARVALLFDNGATVFFAIVMAFWAVFFLEFWKRRQFKLQYDWDMLGYEDAEERARPEFEQKIKRYIRRSKSEKEAKRFTIFNEVLNRKEYIQPAHWFIPKIVSSFSILISMVAVVIAVVFCVLLYRLGVAGVIYRLPGGPSVGDIIVSITGAMIQLVAIIILNQVYERLALVLTNWELHRTQTEYDDSFITKMYLFQFVNFYSSIFYIAFFKGNFTGYPGGYNRIGGLRLDECAAYGCLLELTIQLGIIMVGKQVLNNAVELGVPYGKRLIKWFQHKDDTEEDVYTRWEKDFDLIGLTEHGLFYEYLELVIQYGFVTIFVSAFPLAPLFALLNNWVEIRLDAHKFVTIFRRPVPERAQDIGAWYIILNVVSNLSVLTNGFLIAITAQFVPLELVYIKGDYRDDYEAALSRNFTEEYPLGRYSGYPTFSTSLFDVSSLLDGQAFPFYEVQELDEYDDNGTQIFVDDPSNPGTEVEVLHLPFIDFDCLEMMGYDADGCTVPYTYVVERPNRDLVPEQRTGFTLAQYGAFFAGVNGSATCAGRDLLFNVTAGVSPEVGGVCANLTVECRSRVLRDKDGGRPLRYWQSFTARLGFIVIFEHFIFIISAFIAWLIPDVPQSVQNEIQREKLLAYEAIHTRVAKKSASASASPQPAETVEAL